VKTGCEPSLGKSSEGGERNDSVGMSETGTFFRGNSRKHRLKIENGKDRAYKREATLV